MPNDSSGLGHPQEVPGVPSKFVAYLKRVLSGPQLPENALGGGEVFDALSPTGITAGLLKASLPVFGKAARSAAGSNTSSISLLSRIFNGNPDDVGRGLQMSDARMREIFARAGTSEGMDAGYALGRGYTAAARLQPGSTSEAAGLLRSRMLGASNMQDSQAGRAMWQILEEELKEPPLHIMKRLDNAVIDDLIDTSKFWNP